MTTKQRERWETRTLKKVRAHLRKNLTILQYKTQSDKDEIEFHVMAAIRDAVAKVSEFSIEEKRITISSFESGADLLALNILQDQQMERNWGWRY